MRRNARLLSAVLAFVLPMSATGQESSVATADAQNGTNADVFRQAVGVWERGSTTDLDKFVTADYRGHTSGGDRDRAGLQRRIEAFRSIYSDIHLQVVDQVVSGDRVASRLEASVTETSSGRPVHMMGMNVSRFREGKIAEEWAVWEVVGPTGHQ